MTLLQSHDRASTDDGSRGRSAVLDRPLMPLAMTVLFVVTAAAPFPGSGPVVLLVALLVLLHAGAGHRTLQGPPALVLLFLVWCAASTAWSVAPGLTARGTAVTVATTCAVAVGVGQLDPASVLACLRRAFQVLLALSWAAFLALPGLGREQVAYHHGAFKGVLVQRNVAAFVFGIAVLTFVAGAVAAQRGTRLASLCWGAASLITVVVTQSSTGLAVTLIGLAVLGLALALGRRSPFERRAVWSLCAAASGGLALLLVTNPAGTAALVGRDDTFTGRTVIWAAIRPYVEARPWQGYGWGSLWTGGVFVTDQMWARAHFPFAHAHDAYLDATAQVGIVGLTVLVLLFLRVLLTSGRRLLRTSSPGTAPYAFSLTLFLLLYGITEESFMSYFGLMAVVLAACMLRAEAGPGRTGASASC